MAEPDEHPLLKEALSGVWAKAEARIDARVKEGDAEAADRLVETIAASVPDVRPVTGFILGPVECAGKRWMLLYRDLGLQDWILIPASEITGFERSPEAREKQIPDIVWVERSASIRIGKGRDETIELMFLMGSTTTAGDLDQTLGSRDYPDGGLFGPFSPYEGCGKKSR